MHVMANTAHYTNITQTQSTTSTYLYTYLLYICQVTSNSCSRVCFELHAWQLGGSDGLWRERQRITMLWSLESTYCTKSNIQNYYTYIHIDPPKYFFLCRFICVWSWIAWQTHTITSNKIKYQIRRCELRGQY